LVCTDLSSAADHNPVRQPVEDVNSAAVRRKAGLQPNESLLFNGWGVTPAGDQVPVSDMALKLVVAPDKRRLVAVSGGFSNHGVTLLDMANRQVTQFLSLTQSWNGLAFSKDGRRFFVSGGASGLMHVFKYANGEAAPDRSAQPNPERTNVFLAGIAIHPVTGKLYVCNEGNHEIWVLHPETLALETTIAAGQFPWKPELEDVTMKNRVATARVVWQPRGYDPHLHKWLHRIDVPTLLVWGTNDRLFPKGYAFAWQQLIPGSKVAIVPECGHVPHVEKPSVFVSELQSFINGMRAAA